MTLNHPHYRRQQKYITAFVADASERLRVDSNRASDKRPPAPKSTAQAAPNDDA